MPDAHIEVNDALGRRVIAMDKATFIIGRRSGSDVHVMDTEVSREHAEIAQVAGRFVLRDKGSRYGTFVNGSQISEQPLAHGDRIRLGKSGKAEILFWIGDAPADSVSSGASVIGGFRQVASLLETLQAVGSARLLDEVLILVMDAAIEITEAERGFVMLANAAGELDLKLARAAGKVALPGTGFERSRKIPEAVYASGTARLVTDLQDGDLAQAHEGTIALGIRHVLCVPLRLVRYVEHAGTTPASQSIGVLYLDSREKGTLLSQTARAALETLAAEAAGAIENTRLYREALEKARIDEELKIASQIQQSLLPKPERRGAFFEAYGKSVACRAIGGDFFEYMDLPDGRFGFALGDVAGKGPPAALLTILLQGLFAAHATASPEPSVTATRVNAGTAVTRHSGALRDRVLRGAGSGRGAHLLQRRAQPAVPAVEGHGADAAHRRHGARHLRRRALRTGVGAVGAGRRHRPFQRRRVGGDERGTRGVRRRPDSGRGAAGIGRVAAAHPRDPAGSGTAVCRRRPDARRRHRRRPSLPLTGRFESGTESRSPSPQPRVRTGASRRSS